MWKGIIHQYRRFLPVNDDTEIVTLCEGNTPLIKLKHLPGMVGIDSDWYVKYEGLNPTGSFKDRGMTLAMTQAKAAGSKVVMCASTGNTSASAAAYAANAGLFCCVIIPEGKIAFGKLSQSLLYGALVLQIDGNFDDALCIVRELTDEHPIALVNSVNPFRIDGQKTGAFEIVDALNNAPDYHAIPVGNAGNISAYWKGYREYFECGNCDKLPKMLGFQAAGSAPMVLGHPVKKPETIATAIRIGNPASWTLAEAAIQDSGGSVDMVTDEEITEAQKLLAGKEGIFCEPASAASVAGIIKKANHGMFKKGQCIVSVLTGNGLKDPNRAIEISKKPQSVQGSKAQVLEKLAPFLNE